MRVVPSGHSRRAFKSAGGDDDGNRVSITTMEFRPAGLAECRESDRNRLPEQSFTPAGRLDSAEGIIS